MQDHPLARRHGHRPQADGRQVALLRRRRRHRQPLAKANVEFFGYRSSTRSSRNRPRQEFEIEVENFAENTDARRPGLPADRRRQEHDAVPMARHRHDAATAASPISASTTSGAARTTTSNTTKSRRSSSPTGPSTAPKQNVEFKVWIRHAKYDKKTLRSSPTRRSRSKSTIPRARRSTPKRSPPTTTAASRASSNCPPTRRSGQYYLQVVNHGGGTFRVEEYKKPEFEVTVEAPNEPVMLGEKITATIRAKYYFGSPVTDATVKYKVLRTRAHQHLVSADALGLALRPRLLVVLVRLHLVPRLARLGLHAAGAVVVLAATAPPEIVAEREAPIGPDGTLRSRSTRRSRRRSHPDQDHRYEIQAEVVDQSRRTIVGSGEVLVAREPFRVFAWVDRGYYRVGDTINASFAARRLDGQGVEGTGKLQLLKISYDDKDAGKPIETEVRTWELDTNAEGRADAQIKASEQGQYRLAYAVTDAAGHTIEGGYLFTIVGEGFDGSDFRFNDLEIVPDKARVRARRQSPTAGQHQPRRLHGAAVPAAGERRLPAAAIPAAHRQEHHRADRRRRRGTCRTSSSKRSPSPTAASTRRSAKSSSRRPSAFSTSTSCPRPTCTSPASRPR